MRYTHLKAGIHMGYTLPELGIQLDTVIAIFGLHSISTTAPSLHSFEHLDGFKNCLVIPIAHPWPRNKDWGHICMPPKMCKVCKVCNVGNIGDLINEDITQVMCLKLATICQAFR